jgi:hypothetical protein
MKRWLASLVITAYLGSMGYGIACHTLDFNVASHPGMYFLVWDMFCGWSAYSTRIHIVGEGESGRYYQLAPVPWNDFKPYGDLGRHHYDPFLNHTNRLAVNCLRNTRHEPMRRVYVFEENWAKKYNLPPQIWSQFFDERQEKQSYFNLRREFLPNGVPVQYYPSWISRQNQLVLSAQPLRSYRPDNPVGLQPLPRVSTRPSSLPGMNPLNRGAPVQAPASLFPPAGPPLAQ